MTVTYPSISARFRRQFLWHFLDAYLKATVNYHYPPYGTTEPQTHWLVFDAHSLLNHLLPPQALVYSILYSSVFLNIYVWGQMCPYFWIWSRCFMCWCLVPYSSMEFAANDRTLPIFFNICPCWIGSSVTANISRLGVEESVWHTIITIGNLPRHELASSNGSWAFVLLRASVCSDWSCAHSHCTSTVCSAPPSSWRPGQHCLLWPSQDRHPDCYVAPSRVGFGLPFSWCLMKLSIFYKHVDP